MPKTPQVTGERVVRALRRGGWEQRPGGAHQFILRRLNSDGTLHSRVAVPDHGSRPLSARTMGNILRATGLSIDEFRALL